MSHAYDPGIANRLGALATALADAIGEAGAAVAGAGASAPAALVLLDGLAAGTTIEGLRQALGVTHSGTVRLIDRLAAAGLVERRLGGDARSLSLHLTPAGRRAARRVQTARQAVLEQALTPLDPAQRRRFDDLVAELLRTMQGADQRVCRLCDAEACGRPRGTCPRQDSLSTRG